MHVQAKKQRSAFMLQLDTDRQGLASTTPPLESRIYSESVCWGGVGIPNNFLMDMEMGFPQFLGFTASE